MGEWYKTVRCSWKGYTWDQALTWWWKEIENHKMSVRLQRDSSKDFGWVYNYTYTNFVVMVAVVVAAGVGANSYEVFVWKIMGRTLTASFISLCLLSMLLHNKNSFTFHLLLGAFWWASQLWEFHIRTLRLLLVVSSSWSCRNALFIATTTTSSSCSPQVVAICSLYCGVWE